MPMLRLCLRGQYWALLLIYLLLGTAHRPEQVVGNYNDLLMHFLGYVVAALSANLAYPHRPPYLQALQLWLFSTGVEVIQFFLPWRSFDLWDMLANTSGIVLGLALAVCFKALCRRRPAN